MSRLRHSCIDSSVGGLTLVADGGSLTWLYFPGHRHRPDISMFGRRVDCSEDELLARPKEQLDAYFAGEREDFDVPVRTHVDRFSELVSAVLREMPYGATTIYLGGGRPGRRQPR